MAAALPFGLATGVGFGGKFEGESAGTGAAGFDGETVGKGDGDGLDLPCVAVVVAGSLLVSDCAKAVNEAMQITPSSKNTFFISNVIRGAQLIHVFSVNEEEFSPLPY